MARRPTHAMPADVKAALDRGGVANDYAGRPPYQRNDYLGWIACARGDATRDRRIAQMVAELERGGVYMGMLHRPSAKD